MSENDEEKRKDYMNKRAALAKAWREKNKEKWTEYMRQWRETHREQLRESYKRNYYKQKAMEAEQDKENGMELENCPKCDSAATIKPVSTGYAVGCTSETCGLWVGRQFCHTFGTKEHAAKTWNEFVTEARDGRAEADEARARKKKQKKEQAAKEPQEADVKEAIEEPAEEAAMESYARFELVVDGERYALDVQEDGCEGCAFNLQFGKRSFCAAGAEADMAPARTLCEEQGRKWRKA